MLGLHQFQAGRSSATDFWPVQGLGRGRDPNLELGPGMYIPRPGPAHIQPLFDAIRFFLLSLELAIHFTSTGNKV